MSLQVDDYEFALPDGLIAQTPPVRRTDARLLVVSSGRLDDRRIVELPSLLDQGDLLVFNDTRVIRARLHGTKDSGGRVEVLIERIVDQHDAWSLLRASKTPRPGTTLVFDGERAVVIDRRADLFLLRFERPVAEVLDRIGELPLPPYILHAPTDDDLERYQTRFARDPGSVAAPTAGLHFDDALFEGLAARGIATAFVTLHVGAGTFQPLRTSNLDEHRMHAERYVVPPATAEAIAAARDRGARVIAVGTTTLRTLESAARDDGTIAAGAGETDLFVRPGFRFRIVDRLLTNFHLPRSTLLVLVSAFGGFEPIRTAYAHAISARYRFFSYGDAMLLDPEVPRTC